MFSMKKQILQYKKKCILLLLISILLLTQYGCGTNLQNEDKVSKTDFYFDTVITITLYGTKDTALVDECFSMAAHYEELFSASKDNSDIALINQNAGKQAVSVDAETIALIQQGMAFEAMSNGTFSICCGALSSKWNISEIANQLGNDHQGSSDMILKQEEIDEILAAFYDDHSLLIDEWNQTVFLLNPNVQLDLGAIAKGYIADQMRIFLNDNGIQSGIINLGGNILTVGPKISGKPYQIGITDPFSQSGGVIGGVAIPDGSVVTSGNYERYFIWNDKIYHHILDLETGYPVENDMSSVTIISQSSCNGDALSTICFICGLEKGMELVESLDGIEAIFITKDGQLHFSSGFEKDIIFTSE